MGNTLQPEICPIANICAITAEQAPPCGEDEMHFPPAVIAQEMCPRALARGVELELEKSRDPDYVGQRSHRIASAAWFTFEYGQSLPEAEDDGEHLKKALELANTAMADPYGWFRNKTLAAMLHIYAPVLLRHKQGIMPGEADIRTIRKSLGLVFDSLLAAPIHVPQAQHLIDARNTGEKHRPCLAEEGDQKGLATKLVGTMLAARQGILILPASPRESQARGAYVLQNHDGYMLAAEQKLPVRIRSVPRSRGTPHSATKTADANTIYINLTAEIRRAVDAMQDSDKELYEGLMRYYKKNPPTILEVGRMLRTEASGYKMDAPSHRFLEIIGTSVEKLLFTGREQTNVEELNATWNVLPKRLRDRPFVEVSQRSTKMLVAAEARHSYLRHGNEPIDKERLHQQIAAMREVQDPATLVVCSGAYIELAHVTQSEQGRALRMLTAVESLTAEFLKQDWRKLLPENVPHLFRIGMQNAYLHKYEKVVKETDPDLTDEMALYHKLLACGQQSLQPATDLKGRARSEVRGVQFEVGMHLLNARRNLKDGEIRLHMWPSLPRQNSPFDGVRPSGWLTGWDAAISENTFWNEETRHKLQFKGVEDSKLYDPSITVVIGRDHLTITDTAEIIRLATQELRGQTPEIRTAASTRLNHIEQLFLQRLKGPNIKGV
jgi:hypothetical protein